MAVLPSYTPQGSISSGGDSLRLNRVDDSIGTSIRRLGAELGSAATQVARSNAVASAAEEAEAKRIDGLGDALTRETMETEWKAKQTELETNIDPTGRGHVRAIDTAFKEHMEAYSDKWSGRRYAENQVLNARLRGKAVEHAIDYETRTRLASDKASAEKAIKDLSATVFERPETFDTAKQELKLRADIHGFTGKLYEAFLSTGQRALESARLDAAVRDNPLAVITSGEGAFKDMPTQGGNDQASKIARGAAASGTDLKLMLGIAKIESNLDPNARPIGKDGKPMSSAAGVFQFLQGTASAYGVTDPSDTEGQARALGIFLDKQKERLAAAGIEATPGKLYMFHNLGEPLANALLRAKPDETMADVVRRTYPSRPELAAKVLANNPSLYNANMTVGAAIANYERKMSGAIDATSSMLTGKTETTDEIAKDRMSKLLGIPVEKMGADEFVGAMNKAREQYARDNKTASKLADGQAIHEGAMRADPYDKTWMKDLHAYAATTGIAEGMLQGDEGAFSAARKSVFHANVIAQPYLHSARELVMTGEASSPAKAKAYAFLANVARDNEVAWDASGVPDAVKARVKQFRALTEGDDAIITPAEAIKRITFEHTPAGDSAKKAQQELFKANKHREEKALTIGEVKAAVSKGLWRNAQFFAQDSATGDVRDQVMFDNYKQAYVGYRTEGKDIEQSKKLALQDISDNYKVTNVFRGGAERGEITRYRIEDRYPAVDASRPWHWIEDQGRALVVADAVRKGFAPKEATGPIEIGTYYPERFEVRLMPTAQTVQDFAVKDKLPSYNLMWRNPRTGLWELAEKDWRPNYIDAQAAFDEKFREKVTANDEVARAKQSPEYRAIQQRNSPRNF